MRTKLASLDVEQRHTFIAEFSRLGMKDGVDGETILFLNVRHKDRCPFREDICR